jgi:hypothetical protein
MFGKDVVEEDTEVSIGDDTTVRVSGGTGDTPAQDINAPPIPKKIVPIPWQAKFTDAQDKVVDLLQFISEMGRPRRPLRIAVIISAWDVALGAPLAVPQKPSQYLVEQWPLLHQYLAQNPEDFIFRCFGVSARGGGPDQTEALLKFKDPTDRIQLVEDDHASKDLTRPVRWLLALLKT